MLCIRYQGITQSASAATYMGRGGFATGIFRCGKFHISNWGPLSAVRMHCARGATIWASGRSRNQSFVALWASLLFGSRF